MKNYKSIIFSLTALFVFSVFVISCQQEVITEDLIESTSDNLAKVDTYVLPKGFEDQSSGEIISYVNDLSDSELEKLAENYRIKTFLDTEGLYETIYDELEDGQLFMDIDLSKQLTPEQLQHLNNFSLNDVITFRDGCDEGANYPQYNCHDPAWCGAVRQNTNCYSDTQYCNTPGEVVTERYCGYPHGVLVHWIWYSCIGHCPSPFG